MQIGCEYILQINTVGHMTFLPKIREETFMFNETQWICFSLQKFEHQFFKNKTTKLYEINSKTLFVDVGLTIIFQVLYI